MIKKTKKKHSPFSFLLSMDAKKILFGPIIIPFFCEFNISILNFIYLMFQFLKFNRKETL
jgi:hypothetical protein